MTDAHGAVNQDTNTVVDKKFAEYMRYVADADLNNIQNCMKRNLREYQII